MKGRYLHSACCVLVTAVVILSSHGELQGGEVAAFKDPVKARALIAECETQRQALELKQREYQPKKASLTHELKEAEAQADAARQRWSEAYRLWQEAERKRAASVAEWEAADVECAKLGEACRQALLYGKFYLPGRYPSECQAFDACQERLQPLWEAVNRAAEQAGTLAKASEEARAGHDSLVSKRDAAQSALAALGPDPSRELANVAARCRKLRQAARMGDIDRREGEEFRRLQPGAIRAPESGAIGGGAPVPIPEAPPAPKEEPQAYWPAIPAYSPFFLCFDARGYLYYSQYPCPAPEPAFISPRWGDYVIGYVPGRPFPCPRGTHRRPGDPFGPCYR